MVKDSVVVRRPGYIWQVEIGTIEARLWEEESPPGPVESTRLLDDKRVRQAELDALVEEWAGLADQEERPAPSPRT